MRLWAVIFGLLHRVIMKHLGGAVFSLTTISWPWLTPQSRRDNAALYLCDGELMEQSVFNISPPSTSCKYPTHCCKCIVSIRTSSYVVHHHLAHQGKKSYGLTDIQAEGHTDGPANWRTDTVADRQEDRETRYSWANRFQRLFSVENMTPCLLPVTSSRLIQTRMYRRF